MPGYKQLYGKLYRATEKAASILRQAQEECDSMIMAELDDITDQNQYPFLLEEEEGQDSQPLSQ